MEVNFMCNTNILATKTYNVLDTPLPRVGEYVTFQDKNDSTLKYLYQYKVIEVRHWVNSNMIQIFLQKY